MQEPKNERPVVVAGKDQGEVDNDYLLIPVNILDHEGPLSAAFPVENRLLPQGEFLEPCTEGPQPRGLVSLMAAKCCLHGRLGLQGALTCAGCSYLLRGISGFDAVCCDIMSCTAAVSRPSAMPS